MRSISRLHESAQIFIWSIFFFQVHYSNGVHKKQYQAAEKRTFYINDESFIDYTLIQEIANQDWQRQCLQKPTRSIGDKFDPKLNFIEMEKKFSCKDSHLNCAQYREDNACMTSPYWMLVNCAESCDTCNLQDPKVRCTRGMLNMSTAPAYRPGTFEVMFTNALEEFSGVYKMEVLSRDPWMLSFDDFLTDYEVESLLRAVEGGWSQSFEPGDLRSPNSIGQANSRVRTKSRTSTSSWCNSTCEEDPGVKQILRKIESVLRIPQFHFESFQVLKYERSQLYQLHHDMNVNQVPLPSGPRILTFFFYLSDSEGGGETSFPSLGIDITPKRGKAVLWANVLDANMNAQDIRTQHAALPVLKGTKLAANIWVHLYDFVSAHYWRCTA